MSLNLSSNTIQTNRIGIFFNQSSTSFINLRIFIQLRGKIRQNLPLHIGKKPSPPYNFVLFKIDPTEGGGGKNRTTRYDTISRNRSRIVVAKVEPTITGRITESVSDLRVTLFAGQSCGARSVCSKPRTRQLAPRPAPNANAKTNRVTCSSPLPCIVVPLL